MPLKIINNSHPTFKIGMTADHVLEVARLSHRKAVRPAEFVGDGKYGKIAKWYFSDAYLTLQRSSYVSPYMVSKIEQPLKEEKNNVRKQGRKSKESA